MPKNKTHSGASKRFKVTGSGKILRATMVKIADGETFKMPATIEDPAVLDEIRAALRQGTSVSELFMRADMALYDAKRHGKACHASTPATRPLDSPARA